MHQELFASGVEVKMKKLFILLALLGLSACHTFHLTNGSNFNRQYVTEDWHHIGIVGLVEFSEPVNPKQICDGKEWASVRTREGFLQWLAAQVSSGLYNPQEVAVSCK